MAACVGPGRPEISFFVVLLVFVFLENCSCQEATACSNEQQPTDVMADDLAHEECTLVQNVVRHRVFRSSISVDTGRRDVARGNQPPSNQSPINNQSATSDDSTNSQPTSDQGITSQQPTASEPPSTNQPLATYQPTLSQEPGGEQPITITSQPTAIDLQSTTNQPLVTSQQSTATQLPDTSQQTTLSDLPLDVHPKSMWDPWKIDIIDDTVKQAFDIYLSNVSEFEETAKASSDEIIAIREMPVKNAEIVSEIKRKASVIQEKAELVEEAFRDAARVFTSINFTAFPGMEAFNFTAHFRSVFGVLQQEISRLAASYETISGILTFANVSFIQGPEGADPDFCNLVHDTLDEAQLQLDGLIFNFDIVDRLAGNVTALTANLPSQIKIQIDELMSKAHQMATETKVALLIVVKRFHDAVLGALAGKICYSWKSSAFQVFPCLWSIIVMFSVTLVLLVPHVKS